MNTYLVVTVPQDLLPQVVGELLQFTTDANKVDVVHGVTGREIHVDPLVAEAWLEYRREREKQDLQDRSSEPAATEPEPTPVAEPEPAPAPVPAPEPVPEPAPAPSSRPSAKANPRSAGAA